RQQARDALLGRLEHVVELLAAVRALGDADAVVAVAPEVLAGLLEHGLREHARASGEVVDAGLHRRLLWRRVQSGSTEAARTWSAGRTRSRRAGDGARAMWSRATAGSAPWKTWFSISSRLVDASRGASSTEASAPRRSRWRATSTWAAWVRRARFTQF